MKEIWLSEQGPPSHSSGETQSASQQTKLISLLLTNMCSTIKKAELEYIWLNDTRRTPFAFQNPGHTANDFELTRCRWSVSGNKWVHVVVYRSPRCFFQDDVLLLSSLNIIEVSHKCVITGDFNAPGVDYSAPFYAGQTSLQSQLLEFAETSFLFQTIHEDTRYSCWASFSLIPGLRSFHRCDI